MSKYTVEIASKHVCDLGEGPHWDEKSQSLYYVDLFGGKVCCLDTKTQESQIIHIGGLTSVVVPVSNKREEFIISQSNKLFKLNWNTKEKQLLAEVEKSIAGNRFNDGKCDSKGRLWIGTMGSETDPGVVDPDKGSLYLVDSSFNVEREVENVSLSNRIAWSPDNTKMYFIDSTKRLIYSFDFEINTGNVKNQRVFVDYNNNEDFDSKELPDGMTISKNGNLWVACFNGSRVVNIDAKTGRVIDSVRLPASMITSVCFGGQQLNELYVTSAQKPLNQEERRQQPKAGHIFKITSNDSSFCGLSAHHSFKC